MNQALDHFLKQEIPTLILCNPNRIPVISLKGCYNIEHTVRYNAISELEFDFPQSVDNGATILGAYSMIKIKMAILVKGIGYYVITECPEDATGSVPVKHVSCESFESVMKGRRLTGFEMTSVKLYDNASPDGTILNLVLKYYPGWGVGYIDPDLLISPTSGNEVRRGFEIDNTTLYAFLTSKAEVAYNCIFTFDTINKTVSAYSIPNVNDNVGLFFSHKNIIKEITLTEFADELCTCLYCFGKDDLDITRVNPLGTNCIYNFDYFLTTDWMTQDMVDALTAWKNKVISFQSDYSTQANTLYQYTLDLAQLETNETSAEAELEGLQEEYKALIAGKLDTSDTLKQMREKTLELNDLRVEIGAKQEAISNIQSYLKKVNAQLRFTRKSNLLKFSTDLNAIYTTVKNLSSSWMTTFNINSTDPVVIENNIQLDYDTPTIVGAFNDAITSLDNLITEAKSLLAKYPSIDDSDLEVVTAIIAEASDHLDFLYTIFDGYIPETDIGVQINTSKILLEAYPDILSYESNLTEDQYINLQDYIYENTYTNSNISFNDAETVEYNEAQVQSLYDEALDVLGRISKPRYEIEGNFVNIFSLSPYSGFIEKIDLGKLVTIEIEEGKTVEAALLEIKFTYDDPTSLEMTFSNRVRLNNSNFKFADLFGDTIEKASGVSIS